MVITGCFSGYNKIFSCFLRRIARPRKVSSKCGTVVKINLFITLLFFSFSDVTAICLSLHLVISCHIFLVLFVLVLRSLSLRCLSPQYNRGKNIPCGTDIDYGTLLHICPLHKCMFCSNRTTTEKALLLINTSGLRFQ